MVNPSAPLAAPWQGPNHCGCTVDAARVESTNDHRVAHFSGQRGSGVISGPFGMSAPGRRIASGRNGNSRTSHSSLRVISGNHASASMSPFVQTFNILLIPYSVSKITVLILRISDWAFSCFIVQVKPMIPFVVASTFTRQKYLVSSASCPNTILRFP